MKKLAIVATIAAAHFSSINWLFDFFWNRSWDTIGSAAAHITYLLLGSPFVWISALLPTACYSGFFLYLWFGATSLTWACTLLFFGQRFIRRAKHDTHS